MKFLPQNLKKFSTIRTDSFAEHYCEPKSVVDIKEAIEYKNKNNLSIQVLGNGSNILFSKDHYKNLLFMKLSGDFDFINVDDEKIKIGSGFSLKIAGKHLIKLGYNDFIFFNLIPATVGGAVTQNAGTGKHEEIRDVCLEIEVFDLWENKELTLSNKECMFEYRNSIIKKSNGRYIVLSALFNGKNITPDIEKLTEKMRQRINEKANREPYGYSFGSTFKNNNLPAWKCVKSIVSLLDTCQGAEYSKKHYNWISNKNASGEDINRLIKDTQKNVKSKLNIDLENEVTII